MRYETKNPVISTVIVLPELHQMEEAKISDKKIKCFMNVNSQADSTSNTNGRIVF